MISIIQKITHRYADIFIARDNQTAVLKTVLAISNSNNVKYSSAQGEDEDDDPIVPTNLKFLLFASQV